MITCAAAATAVLLAGCGGGDGTTENASSPSSAAATSSAASKPAASKKVDCDDPTMDQSEWMKNCAGESGAGGADRQSIAAGRPGSMIIIDPETSAPSNAQLVIRSLKCGEPVEKVNSDDPTVKPDVGFQFCAVRGELTNTGDAPITVAPGMDGLVTSSRQTFAADEELHLPAGEDSEKVAAFGYILDEPLNPAKSVRIVQVYEVPKNAKPSHLQNAEFGMEFRLPKAG